ncbi:MAG TPA: right-handed parallel beta-helix repeat-containing protein, partial [Thermoanaerobaculia bacterium]|nr:right-handed parallel beta-helix repeat-containing protein [Thermoanaerobaculia bacterium]
DHWWIPARAFVGERQGEIEWPRDAAASPLAQAPHGVEHHYLRLALVSHDGEVFEEGSETDCRDPFCTLPDACREHAEGGGCCTVSVGEGGDVATVQEAIERLPEAGGVVCIHPGTHRGAVRVEGRQGITLHGCGGRPRLTIGGDGPVVRVADSRDVTLRGLEIVAGTGVAVELEESAEGALAGVLLDDLDLEAGADSAVAGTGGRRVTLRGSRVVARRLDAPARDGVGTRPAVFLSGRDLTVEGNRVTAQLGFRPALLAAGGVQIGGGSVGVTVVGNEIRRGHGNGITLGSLREVDPPVVFDPNLVADLFRAAPFARDRGVFRLDTTGLDAAPDATLPPVIVWNPTPDDGDDDSTAISEGDLRDVQIAGNEIAGMGGNGIAVARFFDLSDDETAEMIVVEDLLVEGNRIHDCLRFRLGAFPEAVRPTAAFGGIALAGCERATFRGNVIEDNGRFRDEAVCGAYLLSAVGASFEGNRIVDNGRPVDPENEPLPGVRGGIVIGLAEAPTTPVTPFGDASTGLRQDGTPALRVHHNVVVSPEGRALEVVAVGAVSVLGNQLTAHGSHSAGQEPLPGGGQGVGGLNNNVAVRIDDAARVPLAARAAAPDPVRGFLDTLGGAVVAIVDLGASNEVLFQLSGLSGTGLAGSRADLAGIGGDGESLFVGGNVMFNDNQVVLDAFLPAVTIAPSAVSIFSWDDVSMLGNQCDCDLLFDAVWFNTLVLGTSVRVTGNRFKEGRFALLSAFTRGWFNATRDNQGTHCFFVVGHPRLSQLGPNASLVDALLPNAAGGGICDSWEQASITASAELGEQLP